MPHLQVFCLPHIWNDVLLGLFLAPNNKKPYCSTIAYNGYAIFEELLGSGLIIHGCKKLRKVYRVDQNGISCYDVF